MRWMMLINSCKLRQAGLDEKDFVLPVIYLILIDGRCMGSERDEMNLTSNEAMAPKAAFEGCAGMDSFLGVKGPEASTQQVWSSLHVPK